MNGGSLGLRTGSYGSLHLQNGPILGRKPSKSSLSSSREKERCLLLICRYLGRKRVAMLLLVVLALLVFVFGSLTVNKESTMMNITERIGNFNPYPRTTSSNSVPSSVTRGEGKEDRDSSIGSPMIGGDKNRALPPPSLHASIHQIITGHASPTSHPCEKFAFPPPPPAGGRRIGPRPCAVCYIPVEQAIASMPTSPFPSPVIHNLKYVYDENPIKSEPHGGSDFGGYPSLKQRSDSFNIKESMTVHCGFVKGSKPGRQTGFDIDEADLMELERSHEIIVASAIFGNYDIIQQPTNISEAARKDVPFYMFIDEETEAFMKNSSVLDSNKRVGLWRIIVVHNIPYADARRNGKVPKLLLHRIFPNVRYSIWIDGKLKLVADPYQVLERFLWRPNASFAISRHYSRFDVFEEAEANKAAGKYENASIDNQIEFYKMEGLTPYFEAKLPITSDVPEGCVLIREHVPITNLFMCLWFNEVDRFTSRDQLSFSTVRDKIMARVDWSVNMFMDCERRNFVIQTYHRDLLEHMPPPVAPVIHYRPPALHVDNAPVKISVKKIPPKHIRDRRSSSKHRHKILAGNRDKNSF